MPCNKRQLSIICLVLALFVSCMTAPVFNEAAYGELCELKVMSSTLLAVMIEEAEKSSGDKSDIEVPPKSQEEIRDLRMRIAIAYEYARNRPDNEFQVEQFEILMGSDGGLLYDLLDKWESDEYYSPYYVEKTIENIETLFDLMLALESGKLVEE